MMTLYNKYSNKSGMTIIELVVTSGIVVLILTVVLSSYPRFRASSSLTATARELGLFIREAQVYGLAVKSFDKKGEDFPAYGVNIRKDNTTGQIIQEIVLFGDVNASGIYENGDNCGGAVTECKKRLSLTGSEYIDKICVNPGGGLRGGDQELEEFCGIDQLNISFKRPDPEASIITTDINTRYNGAKIYLRSKNRELESKVVRVWITGQISIQ